jgi:hypothetical protein
MDQTLPQSRQAATELRPSRSCAADPVASRVFNFESDLERSLVFIPLAVRFKLDKCGIKLALDEWQRLAGDTRQSLLNSPCESVVEVAAFRRTLQTWVKAACGDEPRLLEADASPSWDALDVPPQVTRKALEVGGSPLTPAQWRALWALERFVLVKLSRNGDHGRNFGPALREFGLL